MKTKFTLIAFTFLTIAAFGQSARPSASDTEETVRTSGVRFPDRNEPDAAKVINDIGSLIRARNNSSQNEPVAYTDADYYSLVASADEFFATRKYSDAAMVYGKAAEIRNDQALRDKAIQSEALAAKQQREQDALKKDEILRAKAEAANNNYFGRYLVQLTGGVLSDHYEWHGLSTIFDKEDEFSDFLNVGRYDTLVKYISTAHSRTLDGIAVPARIRVIVYSGLNCTGDVLLDITGPAVINNFIWKDDKRYKPANETDYSSTLQILYPQATRHWSETNMHQWSHGSMNVMVVEK